MVFPIYADSDFQTHAAVHVIIVFRVGIQYRLESFCTKLFEKRTPEISLLRFFLEKCISVVLQKIIAAQITDGFDFFGSRPKMIDSRAGKQRDPNKQQVHDEKNGH